MTGSSYCFQKTYSTVNSSDLAQPYSIPPVSLSDPNLITGLFPSI